MPDNVPTQPRTLDQTQTAGDTQTLLRLPKLPKSLDCWYDEHAAFATKISMEAMIFLGKHASTAQDQGLSNSNLRRLGVSPFPVIRSAGPGQEDQAMKTFCIWVLRYVHALTRTLPLEEGRDFDGSVLPA